LGYLVPGFHETRDWIAQRRFERQKKQA
jgi:hypothetical protein